MALELFTAVRFFTTPPEFNDPSLTWAVLLRSRQTLFGALLLGALAWLAVVSPRLASHWRAFLEAAAARSLHVPLLVQCGACAACYLLAWPLYHRAAELGDWGWPIVLAWFASLLACGFLSLWLLAPVRYWRSLAALERRAFAVAGLGALAGGALITLVLRAWSAVPLLARLTLGWSAALLRQIYPDAGADPATAILGTSKFKVEISDACSGYLGVSLTLGFLACYFYVFRAEIKPWVMLALAPLAIVLSLALNVVRIVTLVVLGVEVSPQVAVNGFHTNAGSIAMVLTFATLVGLVHWGVVSRLRPGAEDVQRMGWTIDFENALLIPLLTLLAATLLTGALSGTFIWLYPLRVAAIGVTLVFCWKHLRALVVPPTWPPVLIGVAVFALWLALVRAEPAADSLFAAALGSVAPGLALAWLAARVIGAVITVPIAEELAFRGYLLTVLSRRPVKPAMPVPFDWPGFTVSSLLFGALHGQWLAGALAGMGYAWARYRRGQLWDAVLAHMTTNLLLAAYVLATRHWSYW